jgi:preprotein translocase subunit SecG
MKILFLSLVFISSILLVILVLLHSAKGEGLGSVGGQARLFSSQRGLESGLNTLTGTVAVIFLLSSLILSALN